MVNLYQILNVSIIASNEEIELAYTTTKLSTDDKSKLWLIDEAYLILIDQEKRAKYNALLSKEIKQPQIINNIISNNIHEQLLADNNKMCSFGNAIKLFFVRAFDFKGRSSRAEYWWLTLFYIVVLNLFVPFLIGIVIGIVKQNSPDSIVLANKANEILSILNFILFLIPLISLCTRRLHDVGRSGWWQLIEFTGIGIIWIIVWNCLESDNATNKYGEKPVFD
jgi:uncharacterized membrane protein YhaH (DUF805 family)